MEKLMFILELIGVAAFAISGAMTAMEKKADMFGVVFLAVTTALGGGIIRDVLLGLPGGLIDGDETPEECARRELKEETGLDLVEIREVLPPAACTVGIGDERTICVFGTAEGEFNPDRKTGEEIEARWYTRKEVLERHKTTLFGSWALAYSWM